MFCLLYTFLSVLLLSPLSGGDIKLSLILVTDLGLSSFWNNELKSFFYYYEFPSLKYSVIVREIKLRYTIDTRNRALL